MSQYILLRKQFHAGCDYSIACGKDYDIFESDEPIDKLEEKFIIDMLIGDDTVSIEELIEYYEIKRDERFLEELILISIDTKEILYIDCDRWFEKLKNLKNNKKEIEKVNQDMAELERLQKLYPDKFK